MKHRHSLGVPLMLDWWGENSDTAIVAWQKEAAVAQSVVHSLYRPVYTVQTAKEEDVEDVRNEGNEWEIWSTQ